MAARVVIVPSNSKILQNERTKKLHEYQNGEVLVETDALTEESEGILETVVNRGIRLEAERERNLNLARDSLIGLANDELILAYLELIGPVDPRWLKVLTSIGIELLRYQPQYSYLCRGLVATFKDVERQSFVLHVTPLINALKPKNEKLGEANGDVWIVVQGTKSEASAIIHELDSLPNVDVNHEQGFESIDFYLRLPAVVNLDGQNSLLKHPRVIAVEARKKSRLEDEIAGLIVSGQYDVTNQPNGSYLQWLDDNAINGESVTVGIVDAGVDTSHEAFSDRIRDLAGGNKSWHGTFVAGHVAGRYLKEKDRNNFIYGVGMAPLANLLSQNQDRYPTDLCKETVSEAGQTGVVQNNSWGRGLNNPMDYMSEEATYDSLVRNADPESAEMKSLTICFSSGNNGGDGLTRPKAAKNVIVTGNSENYRPDSPGRNDSDNINEVYTGNNSSSHGNCGDGRIRPHVVAPGEWTASAGYDIQEGEPVYISPKLTWGGGSSGASPKTAGVCALLIQWWRRHNNNQNPSPAMLRALIVNGAEPMNFRGFIPNKYEGWGRLNIQNILSQDVHHTYVDQTIMLSQRGEQKEWVIGVTDPLRPVKITLSWTDPPGPIGSGRTEDNSAIVNKLMLMVEVNGKFYQGNNFVNGWSTDEIVSGAQKEGGDNLQNVYLKEGVITGTIRVIVKAIEITTNCLNGQVDTPQQDFALVITNGHLDQGYTPGDVFIAIDGVATENPKTGEPCDFWDKGSGNSDADELGSDPKGNDERTIVENVVITGNLSGEAERNISVYGDESWWNEGEENAHYETERQPGLIEDNNFSEALLAGIEIVTARSDNNVMMSSSQRNGLVLLNPYAEYSVIEVLKNNSTNLSNALANLMKDWGTFGVSHTGSSSARSRSAILVVGSGTRLSRRDLDIMRQLAFMGQLYVVSNHSAILSFLAQRIYRQLGVQFRLAAPNENLDALLQDTLAEASGAQRIYVESTTQSINDEFVLRSIFNLVEEDEHTVIRIHYRPDETLPEIKIKRPGQAPFILMPHTSHDNMRILERDGIVQLMLNASTENQGWVGKWEIELTQSKPFEKEEPVRIWAWSGLGLKVQKQETRKNEANRGEEETLVVLKSNQGVTFSHCEIKPRVISNEPQRPSAEEERPIEITIQPSRLNYESGRENDGIGGSEIEASRVDTPRAGSIGAWLRHPIVTKGAKVLDLSITSEGVDSRGNHFKRITRKNFINIEPRSAWRKHIKQQGLKILAGAKITEVIHNSNGIIEGFRLQKGNKSRTVNISSTELSQQLVHINLMDTNLLFHVNGSELIAVSQILNNNDVPIAYDNQKFGIEEPIPESTILPEDDKEKTDYPLASRFVPAKFYSDVTSVRTISRVVVHITDGGSKIDGTINWFENPINADGTYRKVSAHYIVGQDGEVVQMVSDNNIAYHAGVANSDSIGIEHCARKPGTFNTSDLGLTPTAIQYASSASLVRWLCEKYQIPMDRDHILGHSEADPRTSHTGCPNAVWDWDYFMEMVTSGMSLSPHS